jgi:hypothetical protein
MIHLLLFENGGCQNDALAPLPDSSSQKQRAQVLFHGSRADIQFCGDLFVAAAVHQQPQYLLISPGNFHVF